MALSTTLRGLLPIILHRAPVGQGPSGPDWLPIAFGFGLDGRLLLARRGRVYV